MRKWLKTWHLIVLALIIVFLLSAKTFFPFLLWLPALNINQFLVGWWPASWKEEVLLHDERKIIVKRSQTRGGRGEIGQSPIKQHSITFTLQDSGKTITWEDEFSKDVGHSNFDLLALHILNDTPYIVVTTYGCLAYNKWGRPNPPYVFFKFDGNEWKRIPLSEFPPEFVEINTVINASAHEKVLVGQGVVSAEMVKKLNSSLKQPELKNIIRTLFEPEKYGCTEMVRAVDGWLGITWFSEEPNYEKCLEVCRREKVSPEQCPCYKIFNKSEKEK